MQSRRSLLFRAFGAALSVMRAPARSGTPARTKLLAHNAFPDHGRWADRLDRALRTGLPCGVEIDLVWGVNPRTGKACSLVSHSALTISGDEPDLKSYFFERVRPLVENALAERRVSSWPLITLYLDVRNDPPEHLEAIWSVLGEYEHWLSTAVKGNASQAAGPLRKGPVMVLVDDRAKDNKQAHFYDRLPAGGTLRVFGSAVQAAVSSQGLSKGQVADLQARLAPEELLREPPSDYRRWWSNSWRRIELDPRNPGAWTRDKDARLRAFVSHAHHLGYLIGFHCLDGYEAGQGENWEDEYNMGSLTVARTRWKAAADAGVDLLTTDQYEETVKIIRGER